MSESLQQMGVRDITSIQFIATIGKEKKDCTFVSPWSAYTAINTWYGEVPLGKTKWNYRMILSFGEHVIEQDVEMTDYYSYSGFIIFLRQFLIDKDVLSDVSLARATDIHVNWNHRLPTITIRKQNPSNTIPPFRTKQYELKNWNRDKYGYFIELLDGYRWNLDFVGMDGDRHYYNGSLEHIHRELIRMAVGNLTWVGDIDAMYQSDALIGIRTFYARHPEWIERIGSFDLKSLAELTLPGNGFYVQREARKLLDTLPHRIANPYIMKVIEQTELWLDQMYDYQGVVINRPSHIKTSFDEEGSNIIVDTGSRKIIKIDMTRNNPTMSTTLKN